LILGLEGTQLSTDEAVCFRALNPLGFIFFARNIESPTQLAALMAALRDMLKRDDVLFMVDAEGGRVWRFPDVFGPKPVAAQHFGQLYANDPQSARRTCYDAHLEMGKRLRAWGFHINAAPCLDLRVPGANDVVGDRAFSNDPHIVSALGQEAIRGLTDAGMIAIMKHIPGHGAAMQDSHAVCPHITLSETDLAQHFAPFKAQPRTETLWGMTAHVRYTALDAELPATFSSTIIQNVIRGTLGFRGTLVTDDLFMGGAADTFASPAERVRTALNAGCNIALIGKGGPTFYTKAAQGCVRKC
jgi:beta-N-acetylhexosaminidase